MRYHFPNKALLLAVGIQTVQASGYINNGTSTKPRSTTSAPQPTFGYSSFSYTQESSNRYATALPSPVTYTPYAPGFSKLSALLPTNATTTTYFLTPNATDSALPYGQSAYSALWNVFSYNDTSLPFSTTVSPTPVATSELIYPPALYTFAASLASESHELPADFIWGAAGSAWQIEGGLQSEGRGPAELDVIGALPNPNGLENPFITTMNYFVYKQDILRLAAIGIPHYSFSISWPRVVPFGVAGSPVNQQALDHYEDIINFCLENGVTPIVTLVHADLPINVPYASDTFIEDYVYYAKQILTRFSDRVPIWQTFNEPNDLIGNGFAYNTNVLLAHAQIYKFYKTIINGTGLVSLKFANNIAIPLTPNSTAAAFRYQDFYVGIMGNPLFLGAQYPSTVTGTFNTTYFPRLTDSQLQYINGTIDFLSVDPYTAVFVYEPEGGIDACAADPSNDLWPVCVQTTYVQENGWLMGYASNDYAHIDPQYARQALGYLWNTFRPSKIMITEFGFNPFKEGDKTLDDVRFDLERSTYYREFMAEVVKAYWEDGIRVIGCLAWAFVDNDEFGNSEMRYGLQRYNISTFERTWKRSAFDFVDLMRGLTGFKKAV